jgi:hypothetical protein
MPKRIPHWRDEAHRKGRDARDIVIPARLWRLRVRSANTLHKHIRAEEFYFALQKLGEFDTMTSNWIATPADFRELGGALWGGRSYGRVFIGCNGAQSYYATRGFRGGLKV